MRKGMIYEDHERFCIGFLLIALSMTGLFLLKGKDGDFKESLGIG